MAHSRTGASAGTSMSSGCGGAGACWPSTAAAGTPSSAMTSRRFNGGTSPVCSGRDFWRASPPPVFLGAWGSIELTRTHGRREVAFLNRAWEDVLELDLCLDTSRQAQPLLDHAVNTRPSRCAGFEGLGTGLERMAAVLCEREAEI